MDFWKNTNRLEYGNHLSDLQEGRPVKVKSYRGISLLDTNYKVLSLTILSRLEKYAMDVIGEYQSGFIKGKPITNHIFTIWQIMGKYYEYNNELHIIFVDFKQSCDSINRDQLWIALANLGISNKLIRMIKICNSNTFCKVLWQGELSTLFEVKSGLKQGDALFPFLFNLALEKVVRDVGEDRWSLMKIWQCWRMRMMLLY